MRKNFLTLALSAFAMLTGHAAHADFAHAPFNAAQVASVQLCKPGFVKDTQTHESQAVKLDLAVADTETVVTLHNQAKTDHCAVPHVTGTGPQLAILAYLDKSGKPLALVQLWPDGTYYIYEGYQDDAGKIYKGVAKGEKGGCSCGKNAALAQLVSDLLKKAEKTS